MLSTHMLSAGAHQVVGRMFISGCGRCGAHVQLEVWACVVAGMLQAAGCRLLAVACWLQAAGCRQFAAGRWPVLVGTCAHCCAVLSVTPLFSWCVCHKWISACWNPFMQCEMKHTAAHDCDAMF